MSVFDKELIINGKAVRSPEQQVYKNMKDIEELQDIIKPMYKATTSLTSSSTTILISSTNAPDGTKSGWLIDTNGLLFKITGGDETSLLITYYSDLKGPQGESGASLQIDDSDVSNSKVWSSNKTYNHINNVNDKGVYYTTTQPTQVDSTTYELAQSSVGNKSTEVKFQEKDLIIYIDSNDNPTSIYEISHVSTDLTLTKVADYAKGSKLYQHNITLSETGYTAELYIFIINNNPNAMTLDDVKTWLNDKGYNVYTKLYKNIGGYRATTSTPQKYIVGGLKGVYNDSGTIRLSYKDYNGSSWVDAGLSFTTLDEDDVVAL